MPGIWVMNRPLESLATPDPFSSGVFLRGKLNNAIPRPASEIRPCLPGRTETLPELGGIGRYIGKERRMIAAAAIVRLACRQAEIAAHLMGVEMMQERPVVQQMIA